MQERLLVFSRDVGSPLVAMDIPNTNAPRADSKANLKTESKSDEEYEAGAVEHLDSDKQALPYVQEVPTEGVRRAIAPPALVAAMTPERRAVAEKALVRKVDLRLMPMIVLMYIMNYLDRNNIAAARLGALEEDLNLQGNEYAVSFSDWTWLQCAHVWAAADVCLDMY